MKTISISEAKASLSAQIRYLRRGGDEVMITRRGKPVARLVPVTSREQQLGELVAGGLARRASRKLPRGFWSRPRPADPSGSVRAAVDNERQDAW